SPCSGRAASRSSTRRSAPSTSCWTTTCAPGSTRCDGSPPAAAHDLLERLAPPAGGRALRAALGRVAHGDDTRDLVLVRDAELGSHGRHLGGRHAEEAGPQALVDGGLDRKSTRL